MYIHWILYIKTQRAGSHRRDSQTEVVCPTSEFIAYNGNLQLSQRSLLRARYRFSTISWPKPKGADSRGPARPGTAGWRRWRLTSPPGPQAPQAPTPRGPRDGAVAHNSEQLLMLARRTLGPETSVHTGEHS
eukprot:2690752-Pyramimonas_sp.AAC.1